MFEVVVFSSALLHLADHFVITFRLTLIKEHKNLKFLNKHLTFTICNYYLFYTDR